MRFPKKTTLAIFAAVTALTLAGCSSNSDEADPKSKASEKKSGVEFDFTEINGIPAAKKITFKVPAELLKNDKEYAEDRVLTSVTASSRKLDSPEFCAIDFAYTYADGALSRVKESTWFGSTTYTGDPTFEYTKKESPAERVVHALDVGSASNVGGLDLANLETGTYLSEDFQTATVVTECAAGPTDSGSGYVIFNEVSETESAEQPGSVGAQTFAEASLSVMKNGDLNVTSSEVNSWALDANGTWIKP